MFRSVERRSFRATVSRHIGAWCKCSDYIYKSCGTLVSTPRSLHTSMSKETRYFDWDYLSTRAKSCTSKAKLIDILFSAERLISVFFFWGRKGGDRRVPYNAGNNAKIFNCKVLLQKPSNCLNLMWLTS